MAEQVQEEQEAQAQQAADQPQEDKVEPIRMPTTAVGEVSAFITQKIAEVIGRLEFYERARLSGAPVPSGITEYDAAKLRDLNVIRDSLTNVFFYKRLSKEEATEIANAFAEAVKKQAEQTAPPAEAQ